MRILLIEDDHHSARALALLLGQDGHDVALAPDCASARAQCREGFDLLIVDVMLPDGDGWTLYPELRPHHDGAAVSCSAGEWEDARVRSLAAGFDLHLGKPLRMEVLRDFLRCSPALP